MSGFTLNVTHFDCYEISVLNESAKRLNIKTKSDLFSNQERNMMNGKYLDAINSLLASGEYPFLFTNDELDSLLLVS